MLKYTLLSASMRHPFRTPEALKDVAYVYPSAVAADLHSASVPTGTEPAGHTFVPGVTETPVMLAEIL